MARHKVCMTHKDRMIPDRNSILVACTGLISFIHALISKTQLTKQAKTTDLIRAKDGAQLHDGRKRDLDHNDNRELRRSQGSELFLLRGLLRTQCAFEPGHSEGVWFSGSGRGHHEGGEGAQVRAPSPCRCYWSPSWQSEFLGSPCSSQLQ